MRKRLFFLLCIFLLFSCVFLGYEVEADYNPVISGKLDSGEKIYTNFDEENKEELDDKYKYNRVWLKYKQKLTTREYYYLKFQYYKKDYYCSNTYNNIGLDFWGNYTYQLTEKTRNRWKINIRNKDYYSNKIKSYKRLRINYEVDYDYNSKNDYGIVLQRQWNNFTDNDSKNYFRDKVKLEWDHDYNDKFTIESSFQYERQIYDISAGSSNKYGKQISVGFDYEL